MISKRKFYKRVIQVTVLSEEPYDYSGLATLANDIQAGDCSGQVKTISTEEISGVDAAKALIEQGSDPEFFMLTEDGKDIE